MSDSKTSATGCCGTAAQSSPSPTAASGDVHATVRAGYAAIARTGQWSGVSAEPEAGACCTPGPSNDCCSTEAESADCCAVEEEASSCCAVPAEPATGGGCCGAATLTADDVAKAVGYAPADLASLPAGANMGLSCGNPTALASLKPGEVVLDLGAGGGFDCFIAGPRVGATGRVIGVDMTPEMVSKARAGLDQYRRASGLDNVEFRLGEIEHLPVPDASVDVVISNCVINLSPDKAQVWREIARVLKPGGRVAVSDLALLRPLPEDLKADVEALVGCVAGAELVSDTEAHAKAAGLVAVDVRTKPEYVAAFEDAQDPLYRRIAQRLPHGLRTADFVTSADVTARKTA